MSTVLLPVFLLTNLALGSVISLAHTPVPRDLVLVMSREDGAGLKGTARVDLSHVQDRPQVDRRFERYAGSGGGGGGGAGGGLGAASSTFDALTRMAAGLDGRTLAEKMNDPNRPTWEQYKKQNEDKLDLVDADAKKMVQYREQLDREREQKLAVGSRGGKKTTAISDTEEEEEEEEESDDNSSTSSSGSSSSTSSSPDADRKSKKDKKRKREKKEKKKRKEKDKEKKNKKDKKKKKRRKKDKDKDKER